MSGERWGRKGKNVLQEEGRAYCLIWEMNFSGGSVVKKLPGKAGDTGDGGLIPGSGRSPGGENGNPVQYSCWEIPWTEEAGKEVDITESVCTCTHRHTFNMCSQ